MINVENQGPVFSSLPDRDRYFLRHLFRSHHSFSESDREASNLRQNSVRILLETGILLVTVTIHDELNSLNRQTRVFRPPRAY